MSMAEAAGFPAVWLTAYYGFNILTNPRKGQKVLVHSAAGGVGSALVQLGKLMQCEVVGVVGTTEKVTACKQIGADYVIDKSTENLWEKSNEIRAQGYDIILDANGVSTLQESYNHLSPGGKLVVYGFHSMLPKEGGLLNFWTWPKLAWDWFWTPTFDPMKMTGENKSVLAFNLSYLFDQQEIFMEYFDFLWNLVNENKIIPCSKVTEFNIEDAGKAHALIESGKSIGKIILKFAH